jgi:hypothetical protein
MLFQARVSTRTVEGKIAQDSSRLYRILGVFKKYYGKYLLHEEAPADSATYVHAQLVEHESLSQSYAPVSMRHQRISTDVANSVFIIIKGDAVLDIICHLTACRTGSLDC